MTFKEWNFTCACGWKGRLLAWDYELLQQNCPTCSMPVHTEEASPMGAAPGVIGDELNNYAAKHGVCHPDGTPRVFHSKTDLKRALNEKGLVIYGDTPGKPYKV